MMTFLICLVFALVFASLVTLVDLALRAHGTKHYHRGRSDAAPTLKAGGKRL